MTEPIGLAKIEWQDPVSGQSCELTLTEGAVVRIGRLSSNDICIVEQHVSREHAVITYKDGVFLIRDAGSANGTYVNDHKITEPYVLVAGDKIRLFVPTLSFLALQQTRDEDISVDDAGPGVQEDVHSQACLVVTNGPQEGQTIPLLLDQLEIGRATSSASWEIMLQDPSVSRPHARLERHGDSWLLFDLGSANGTLVNNRAITEKGRLLQDGDSIALGGCMLLFRSGWGTSPAG